MARHLSRERENCQNQRILIEIQARECSYVRLAFRLCTINILRIFLNPLKLVPSLEKRRLTRTKLLTFASMITVWLHKCLFEKGTWVEQHLSMESEPGDWIGLDYSQYQQYPIVIKKIYWYLKEKKIPLSNDNIDGSSLPNYACCVTSHAWRICSIGRKTLELVKVLKFFFVILWERWMQTDHSVSQAGAKTAA